MAETYKSKFTGQEIDDILTKAQGGGGGGTGGTKLYRHDITTAVGNFSIIATFENKITDNAQLSDYGVIKIFYNKEGTGAIETIITPVECLSYRSFSSSPVADIIYTILYYPSTADKNLISISFEGDASIGEKIAIDSDTVTPL